MNTVRWGIIGCGDVTEVKSGPAFQKARGSGLVAVMRRNGALAEDYARRHGVPRFLQVRALLADGAIGDPVAVVVTHLSPPAGSESASLPGWRVSPEIAGGGYFVDLGSHTLDLLDFLLGPVQRAEGSAANRAGLYPAEDLVTARLTFASGVQGVGVWSFSSAERREQVEIFGTRATLRFSVFADAPVALSREGVEEVLPHVPHPPHVQQPLIQTVVDALIGRGTCLSTGESAARTSHVIDSLLADHRAQGAPAAS